MAGILNITPQARREILALIAGSNITLRDKKIHIQPVGPFKIIAKQA